MYTLVCDTFINLDISSRRQRLPCRIEDRAVTLVQLFHSGSRKVDADWTRKLMEWEPNLVANGKSLARLVGAAPGDGHLDATSLAVRLSQDFSSSFFFPFGGFTTGFQQGEPQSFHQSFFHTLPRSFFFFRKVKVLKTAELPTGTSGGTRGRIESTRIGILLSLQVGWLQNSSLHLLPQGAPASSCHLC